MWLTGGRVVDKRAALEGTVRKLELIEAHQGTAITKCPAAPVFDVAEEVVHSAVGPEVLAGPADMLEVHTFAGSDCHTVIGIGCGPGSQRTGIFHALEVTPAGGKESDC